MNDCPTTATAVLCTDTLDIMPGLVVFYLCRMGRLIYGTRLAMIRVRSVVRDLQTRQSDSQTADAAPLAIM